MFNKYYQDELTYLRELGREFATAYPGVAPMLAERPSVDPLRRRPSVDGLIRMHAGLGAFNVVRFSRQLPGRLI